MSLPSTSRLALAVLLTLSLAPAAVAEGPKVTWGLEARLRAEAFDALHRPGRESDYDLLTARLRANLDIAWTRWKLHGMVQGAAADGIPENADFGLGTVYFAANRDDAAEQLTVAELNAAYVGEGWQLTLGRQGWSDGVETMTGVKYLDGVKRRRLGERLIGNLDWPLGRRFDGAGFALDQPAFHLSAFGLRPTSGAVDYDAFEQLDEVTVYGATLTGKYGQWLPKGEGRFFAYGDQDDRPSALTAAGGELDLQTLGSSLLVGNDRADLLAWVAFQQGDWGRVDHQALAFLVEAGANIPVGALSLGLRGGVAYASGDDAPGTGDHETFFNMLPTNHKYYGSADYVAFANLREVFVEAQLAPAKGRGTRLAVPRFERAEEADAWYVGSGAVNDRVFGFNAVPISSGAGRSLGTEVDVDVWFALPANLRLDLYSAFFWGGDSADARFGAPGGRSDGSWVSVQLTWKR